MRFIGDDNEGEVLVAEEHPRRGGPGQPGSSQHGARNRFTLRAEQLSKPAGPYAGPLKNPEWTAEG